MKTDDLVDLLAQHAGPAPRGVVARRLGPVVLMGLVCSGLLAFWLLGAPTLPNLDVPATWVKLIYAFALAFGAGVLASRLARPISHLRWPKRSVWLVIGLMLVLGASTLLSTPADRMPAALFGQTWLICPWALMLISLPALAGILWAVRGLAPTQLDQAGWACGLLAGAIGALGYAVACPESSPAFVAVWYTLGILMTALLGRWLGPVVLRW